MADPSPHSSSATLASYPTTVNLIFRALRRYGDDVAFSWDGGSLTYRGVRDQLGRLQSVMIARGMGPPSRVALVSANLVSAWCAAIAAQALGCLITWLHPRGSLRDHIAQMRDAGIDTLIVDAQTYGTRGEALREALPALQRVFSLGASSFGEDLMLLASLAGSHDPRDFTTPNTPSNLSYTGGTTGVSKAAVRTQSIQAALSMAILSDFELPARPRLLCAAPMSHVGGSKIVPTLIRGGRIHFIQGFDAEHVLRSIESERINMTLLVPTMVYMLLDHPALSRHDLTSLELLLYGGSAMSPTRLLEGLDRLGPVFAQLYGLAECYPIASLRRADHDPRRSELLLSCGQPVSSCEIRLLDEELQEVAPGQPGEICVRAPQMMLSYWEQPEMTAQALRGGWLHTGDVAYADDRGFLFIVDRKKDMIVSGGFNIYPREIEDVLAQHPAVALCTVIGVPHDKWGESVTAVVVCRQGQQVSAEDLIELVRREKGSRQAPKDVIFVDSLPTTAVGKIDKKAVREPFWAHQSRRVA